MNPHKIPRSILARVAEIALVTGRPPEEALDRITERALFEYADRHCAGSDSPAAGTATA